MSSLHIESTNSMIIAPVCTKIESNTIEVGL